MTVKSDRWIRRMCEEAQLISPFESQLVRQVEGRRIISAGASSYGYDMRLADDGFRVFSPIHGREIDPKHFDEDCLVDRRCGRPKTARNIISCRRIRTRWESRSKLFRCRAT